MEAIAGLTLLIIGAVFHAMPNPGFTMVGTIVIAFGACSVYDYVKKQ